MPVTPQVLFHLVSTNDLYLTNTPNISHGIVFYYIAFNYIASKSTSSDFSHLNYHSSNYDTFDGTDHNSTGDSNQSSITVTHYQAHLSKSPQSGFTLVEILVVVVILSIFAGMVSLSVGSSDSRKNRAFYEHITDSLSYVRLLSAERMQPMGLALQADKQGQVTPVIVTLSNPYIAYQTSIDASGINNKPKNAMELSADISSRASDEQNPTPSWDIEPEVTLPTLPAGVSLNIQSLEGTGMSSNSATETRTLQPWFTDQTVPQLLWFGTGQATPVTIEIRHDSRLVGEVITIMPDGNIVIGQGL